MEDVPQQAKQSVDELINELDERTSNIYDADLFGAYSWEQEVERSWDALVEHDGVLEYKQKDYNEFKRNYLDSAYPNTLHQIRKGMIRNFILLMDMSSAMQEMDFRPDRLECAFLQCEEFITEFFLQNPISHMGIVVMRNMNAMIVQPLSASPEEQISKLRETKRQGVGGAPSLQNGLERAIGLLSSIPPYGTREILIIFGALRSCDAGMIDNSITKLHDHHIRVSVVSMAPELYILKRISKETGGTFSVALHKNHFHDLLMQHTHPPPWSDAMQPTLVRMGFPRLKRTATAALCVCHQKLTFSGYICPQCGSKVCEVPSRCKSCLSNLVSPADISRTYHHLFPPSPFEQLPPLMTDASSYTCSGCSVRFKRGGGRCMECNFIFCYDCDIYTHEQLHHCPFCIMTDIRQADRRVGKQFDSLTETSSSL